MESASIDPLYLVAFKVASLLHDPPWKPWGIKKSGYSIAHCGESYDICIAREVARGAELITKSNSIKTLSAIIPGLDKAISRDNKLWSTVLEALKGVVTEANNWVGTREKDYGRSGYNKDKALSHERQALLLIRLLGAALKYAGLEYCAKVMENAGNILDKDEKGRILIHRADALASTLDRSYTILLYSLEGKNEEEKKHGDKQVYINPFNPEHYMTVNREIRINQIANYILYLIILTVYFMAKAARSNGDSECKPLLLYSFIYSVLEPLWYLVTGPGYVPVADTRVPTHTVFDHVAATTMVSNWLLGNSLGGCFVIVDLKSVQSWIGESRRLRDAWASSWLASWLAWETVRPFIEKYGPDVLIQPPTRLHPFYASWLLSSLGCTKASSEEEVCNILAKLLGLPYGWPLDPTVPTMARLALPEEACRNQNLEKAVSEAYWNAWHKVMKKLRSYIEAAISLARTVSHDNSNSGDIIALLARLDEDAREELLKSIENLEPPLPIQLRVRSVNEASKRALRIARELTRHMLGKTKITEQRLHEMLLYQVLIDDRLWEDKERPTRGFRATGRRSGYNYLKYTRTLYEAGRRLGERLFYNCHVCGSGAAILDGEELHSILRSTATQKLGSEVVEKVKRLAANMHNERLCPYCLTKRMLRDMLYYDDLAIELVGLKMPDYVYDRLGRVTVDFYTSRLRRNAAYLSSKVEEIVTNYYQALLWLYSIGFSAINQFIKPLLDKTDETYWERIKRIYSELRRRSEQKGIEIIDINTFKNILALTESLTMNAIHDLALPARIQEEAEKLGSISDSTKVAKELEELADKLEELAREVLGRRTYALVINDGDRMGSGILSGRLGIEPENYVEKIVKRTTLPTDISNEVKEFYRNLVNAYEEQFPLSKRYTDRTVIITPSYHQAVSRALAAQSILDREVIEKLGGLILYSGGDDATAVLPPMEPDRDEERIVIRTDKVYREIKPLYPALVAAAAMRRLYWGLTPIRIRDKLRDKLVDTLGERGESDAVSSSTTIAKGFNTVAISDRRTVAVVPALVVYGRSTVVYYADSKDPFWLVFREAHEILESKDNIAFIRNNECSTKDSFIVAGAAGAALLPLSGNNFSEAAGAVEKMIELLKSEAWSILEPTPALQKNEATTYRRPLGLSSSAFNDARIYALEALEASLASKKEAVKRLAEHVISRNIIARNINEAESIKSRIKRIMDDAINAIRESTALSIYTARKESDVLAEFLSDGFCFEIDLKHTCIQNSNAGTKGKVIASNTLFQVFNAARITRSAR